MISSRFRRSNMEFKNSRFHSDRDTIVGRRVVRGVYRGEDNGAIPHPRGGGKLKKGERWNDFWGSLDNKRQVFFTVCTQRKHI